MAHVKPCWGPTTIHSSLQKEGFDGLRFEVDWSEVSPDGRPLVLGKQIAWRKDGPWHWVPINKWPYKWVSGVRTIIFPISLVNLLIWRFPKTVLPNNYIGFPTDNLWILGCFGGATISGNNHIFVKLGGGNSNMFGIFTPKIGEDDPILTNICFKGVGSTTS